MAGYTQLSAVGATSITYLVFSRQKSFAFHPGAHETVVIRSKAVTDRHSHRNHGNSQQKTRKVVRWRRKQCYMSLRVRDAKSQ